MSRRRIPMHGVFIRRCTSDECEDKSLLVYCDGREIGHVYGWGERAKRMAAALGDAAKNESGGDR